MENDMTPMTARERAKLAFNDFAILIGFKEDRRIIASIERAILADRAAERARLAA